MNRRSFFSTFLLPALPLLPKPGEASKVLTQAAPFIELPAGTLSANGVLTVAVDLGGKDSTAYWTWYYEDYCKHPYTITLD